jgi:hypothetical protein
VASRLRINGQQSNAMAEGSVERLTSIEGKHYA